MSFRQFLAIGSEWTRSTRNCETVQLKRFVSFFGVMPDVCEYIWSKLSAENGHPHNTRPLYLLCALLFLRQYNVESVNHAITGLDEKTFRKWSWIYIERLAFGMPDIVSLLSTTL